MSENETTTPAGADTEPELPAPAPASALNAAQRLAVGRALLLSLEARARTLWGSPPGPGYEHHLWDARDEDDVADRDVRTLAELCDGWWVWEETGPLFVSLEAWAERRRAREGDPGADPDAGSAQAEATAGTERTRDEEGPQEDAGDAHPQSTSATGTTDEVPGVGEGDEERTEEHPQAEADAPAPIEEAPTSDAPVETDEDGEERGGDSPPGRS